MAISADYSTPVQINGYSCKNCTDVAYAKKHIDPEHPKSGPYNVNASVDPSRVTEAVVYGGNLSAPTDAVAPSQHLKALGGLLDVSA